MSILKRYENILLDPTALIMLHSREFKEFIPIIVAKLNAYTTIFSIIEFLSMLNYYGIKYDTNIINKLTEIYKLAEINDEIILRAASIRADLIRHRINTDTLDIIHVSICKEKGLILVTTDPSKYDIFRKYGIEVIHIQELINIVKRVINKAQK